jgi:RNA-directed DNA polymerase
VLRAHPREGDLQRRFLANQRLRQPHLPQGSPTSPGLSNLAAFRLDRRLQALADAFGATVTRYADDLAFAGDARFQHRLGYFLPQVGAIALEEGFRLNHRKTRVMSHGQRQELCGVVVNHRPGIPRADFDQLRALLFNAARFGPASQNREGHPRFRAHLEGRIAWVASLQPARGARLRALFQAIDWAGEKTGLRNP